MSTCLFAYVLILTLNVEYKQSNEYSERRVEFEGSAMDIHVCLDHRTSDSTFYPNQSMSLKWMRWIFHIRFGCRCLGLDLALFMRFFSHAHPGITLFLIKCFDRIEIARILFSCPLTRYKSEKFEIRNQLSVCPDHFHLIQSNDIICVSTFLSAHSILSRIFNRNSFQLKINNFSGT